MSMNIHYFPIISRWKEISPSSLLELECFVPSLVQIDPLVQKENFKYFSMYFFCIAVYFYYLSLKSGVVLYLYKVQS